MIRLEAVHKTFPAARGRSPVEAVRGIDLHVREGELICLIGASGCGKSTTLRLVNRLIEPSAGRVLVGGRDVRDLDEVALRRGIGYVIQRGGLFPHLDVAGNLELLPRLEGWDRARRATRTREVLELVQLDPAEFAHRFPRELSGGQAQRVGVARALVLDPPVMLLDEPFGALDPLTRRELQDEFARLRERLGKTIVMVSHDLDEAFRLADRVALMRDGRIVQLGRPSELRDAPADDEAASFVSGGNA